MQSLSQSFRALADTTRLRILRLIAEAPLNVSEMVAVIGVGQSSISHHLAKLRAQGLVREERQAGYSYYALAIGPGDPRWPLVRLAVEEGDDQGDRARLRAVLEQRDERLALNERLLEPGQSWFVVARAFARLLPPMDAADFGCGSGALSFALAGIARSVTGIDRNEALVAQAAARARREGLSSSVRFVVGDLHALDIGDGSFDLVVISQSLHHVEDPRRVLGEAARVLRSASRLCVLELLPHRETWVRERLGHRALGFEPAHLEEMARSAGFRDLRIDIPSHDAGSPFRVFVLTGVTP